VAAISLTGVEANLTGVPSEAPNPRATSLPQLSCTWDSANFLLNGDEAVDSPFTTGLVMLSVEEEVEDLFENILLKEGGKCDVTPIGC